MAPSQARFNTFKYDISCGVDDYILQTETFRWEGQALSFDYKIADIVQTPVCSDSFAIRVWHSSELVMRKVMQIK